ncbi:MAG TPA: helix-turn-helix domain-containing protein [Bryobacteraceae bacterium]|nr:helix-turn-helix domain-containing protein [Bryobacteraceae bacterium]
MTPMNPTSRAIFQSVMSSDATLTSVERSALERLLRGESAAPAAAGSAEEQLLLSQKKAAKLLDVSRVTVWRMTKECVLHPVEILPGTWRYPYREIAGLAQSGEALVAPKAGGHQTVAA